MKAQRVFEEILRSRARATDAADADAEVAEGLVVNSSAAIDQPESQEEAGGSPMSAAVSSFLMFSLGAIIPVLPYIFGMAGVNAALVACVLVGMSLMFTGGVVGLLSGMPPAKRAFRQLAIGATAAGVTYALGSLFDVSV